MLLLLASLILVRFDGSLKPPKSDGTARITFAAATISSSTRNQDILYIGASRLDATEYTTSGEAEFAGLILGLEGILEYQDSLSAYIECGDTIQVEGDCKTVIQQMQGRSLSRKLGPLCQVAKAKLSQIPWKVQFAFVPRVDNFFCDRICYGLMVSRHQYVVQEFCDHVLEILGNDNEQSSKHDAFEKLLADYFINGKTTLSGFGRLQVYSILTKAALLDEYFELVCDIGQRMQQLADTMLSAFSEKKWNRTELVRLKVEGIEYEIDALRRLGQEKEAVKVERREKTMLLRHADGARDDFSPMVTTHQVKIALVAWAERECSLYSFRIRDLLAKEVVDGNDTEVKGGTPGTPLEVALEDLLRVTSANAACHWVSVQQ